MAAGIDDLHLQQHLVDKLQKQASEEVSPRAEANPADVEAYQNQMNAPDPNVSNVSQIQTDNTQATPPVEKSAELSHEKSPGDEVLKTLTDLDKNLKDVANQPLDKMSVSDTLNVEVKMAEVSTEEGLATAVTGKVSKDVDTLLKTN